MNDALLANPDKKEALSRVYAKAVAACAGYTTSYQDFDRDGVDIQIRAGGSMRPSLDIQLKATINLDDGKGNKFRYPLKRRNYDLLRKKTQVPRILVVLDLPRKESSWVDITEDSLIMRRCAYWTSLAEFPETRNESSITISIDKKNRFDVAALKELMEKSRTGGDL